MLKVLRERSRRWAVACLLVVGAAPAYAGADDILFTGDLTADEETHVTESPGKGRAEVWLERETLKITWKITYSDLAGPPAKIGLYGPENPGSNAGLQVDLGANGLKSPVTGSVVLTDGLFQYLITGRMYVNVLTAREPKGELRGQLRRQLLPEKPK